MQAWSSVYLGFLAFGWGLLLLSLLLGWAHHGGAHHGADAMPGADPPGVAGRIFSFFQIGLLAPFCIWFGAIGYALVRGMQAAGGLAFTCAGCAGVLGSAAVRGFARRLVRSEEPLAGGAVSAGAIATVSGTICPGGTGEIQLLLAGKRRWLPARSSDRVRIERGAEVVVVATTGGIAEVIPLDD